MDNVENAYTKKRKCVGDQLIFSNDDSKPNVGKCIESDIRCCFNIASRYILGAAERRENIGSSLIPNT